MAAICKDKVKCEYWHTLPVTVAKFFKIMLGDFEHQLRIPREFVQNFREKLSCWCVLRGQSGNEWKVQVTKEGDDVFFSGGWAGFVNDQCIKAYDFLVFFYAGDSVFEVIVFSGTGCERIESHFAKLDLSKSFSTIRHVDETDNEETDMNDGNDSESFRRGDNKRRGQKSQYNAVYKGKWKVDHLHTSDLFGDHYDGDVKDGDDGNGDDDDEVEYKEGEEETEESFSYSPHFLRREKQIQKCYISGRRAVTDGEKQRAAKMADDHIKRNISNGVPMVGITMLPTHVYKGFYVTIPKDWATENMICKDHEVELHVPGINEFWLVGCRWIRSIQCQLRPKWADFVLANNIEEGDVCVFELVRKGGYKGKTKPVFKVRIFRVVPEVVPQTKCMA